eukprot:c2928_g1_i1.p1 GENE.c2928_g1_i1~~c2928_g1_i1.p1  ORF type:complete len:197 (-),score=34.30 c2928_g1_i1:464-1054(-)
MGGGMNRVVCRSVGRLCARPTLLGSSTTTQVRAAAISRHSSDERVRENTLADKTWTPPQHTKGHKNKGKKVLLSQTLRQFIKLVHPDRFATTPELQAVNQQSLQVLNEFLQHIKTKVDDSHPYPAAQARNLEFFLKSENKGLQKLRVELRTTGGNCHNLVNASLSSMFSRSGLDGKFEWDDGYWEESNVHLYEDIQ